jgi:hypothetical protein
LCDAKGRSRVAGEAWDDFFPKEAARRLASPYALFSGNRDTIDLFHFHRSTDVQPLLRIPEKPSGAGLLPGKTSAANMHDVTDSTRVHRTACGWRTTKPGEEYRMAENSGAKAGPFIPRKKFTRWRQTPFRSKGYLELLAHYDAELEQTDGPIAVVGCKTRTELRLEQKGKLLMVRLLLDEFGTVDGANRAIGDFKASHS